MKKYYRPEDIISVLTVDTFDAYGSRISTDVIPQAPATIVDTISELNGAVRDLPAMKWLYGIIRASVKSSLICLRPVRF